MSPLTPSPLLALAVVGTQLLGPAVLWAADQRGIQIEANRRVVVFALSGQQVTAQSGGGTKALQFRDAVNVGDQLATGNGTMAEVLVGNRAVVILDHNTAARFTTVSDEQATIQVTKGIVRVAVAASALGEQGIVTVQTPTGHVQTRGGIVRVMVDQPAGAAEQTPIEGARPYLASYSPSTTVAVLTPRSEIIQVEEGSAEIAGAGGKAVTVQAGQSVKIQSGQAGPIAGFTTQDNLRPGVVATAGHSQTPKEGLDNLVALQVEQATALGNALTGAAETGKGEAGKKDDSKNAINGATGGVALASGSGSLINSLFGGGATSNPAPSIPGERLGSGFGGNNNSGFGVVIGERAGVNVNNKLTPLLVFTRKDPVAPFLDGIRQNNIGELEDVDFNRLTFGPEPSVVSTFTVKKELVLIGGSENFAHGGIAPDQTLIVRGAAKDAGSTGTDFNNLARFFDSTNLVTTNDGLYPSDRAPVFVTSDPRLLPEKIAVANSTFVVEQASRDVISAPGAIGSAVVGGTLGQYSNVATPSPNGIAIDELGFGQSHVDGAITATSSKAIPVVTLTGGVTLDQGTKATIGTTIATNNYYTADAARKSTLQNLGATFSGSLLSVINGPNNGVTTSVTVQDRLLGVYDGSTINTNGGNKALLSVLDAKLTGPAGSIPLIDIAAGSHFDRAGTETPGSKPNVTVTSALVTRSTVQLDGALLAASTPLFALTKATMTTTNHFADLAGNKAQSMLLNDSLVALNASQLTVQKGHLLNLNAATATVNGYLFSLNNGSTLTLNNGALFNLANGSSLNLTANAFGVFGSGANTLSINNNLCGGGSTCGLLVNAANTPFSLNGTPLQVSGATENVVLPNGFNVFALAPGAPAPTVTIGADDALFRVDGTSTLTINGTEVR